MALISVPNQPLANEGNIIRCSCFHSRPRRSRLRTGIRVAAAAGMLYAGYMAYQRSLVHLEHVSAVITWFAERLRNEVETHKRLEELSSQLGAAERRATQLQRSLDKLVTVCGREPLAASNSSTGFHRRVIEDGK